MTQSKSDLDFLDGLHLMIDSIESSHLAKTEDHHPAMELQDDDDLPEATHWCPDVQAWHTADHGPAQAPSVHVNVDNDEEDTDVEKIAPLLPLLAGGGAAGAGGAAAGAGAAGAGAGAGGAGLGRLAARAAAPQIGESIGRKIGQKIEESDSTETESITGAWNDGDEIEKVSVAARLKDVEHGTDAIKEYDEKTNLDRETQENSESSVAEPFLNRYAVRDDEEEGEDEEEDLDPAVQVEKQVKADAKREPLAMSADFVDDLMRTHAKSIDILKIWSSVDRVLPKTDLDIDLVDDISILKSFELDETTNVEDLVEGTLVYKMLVDRANRPTSDWWESSMFIAKSIDNVDEPAFLSAYLYYDPDTFELRDFIDLEKAEVTRGKPQDLEMMPNSSGGSPIDGLGMSADGPGDKDCD